MNLKTEDLMTDEEIERKEKEITEKFERAVTGESIKERYADGVYY